MEIAKIQLARSIWLFDTAELNPHGSNVYPDLYLKIAEHYRFRTYPNITSTAPISTSVRLENGQFLTDAGRSFEVSLEIFPDGITADCRHSTVISDLFIADVIKWACHEFGLTLNNRIGKKRAYRSEIIIYAPKSLEGLCEILDNVAKLVSEVTGNPAELSAISFGDTSKVQAFSFERKANEPFDELKFYSAALMETENHFKILQALEQVLHPPKSAGNVKPND
jgi:hypothetical protein